MKDCTECRSEGTQACIACLRGRLRETAQILIAAVGADGPMDAEEAARRAVAKLEIADRERQSAFDAHAKLSNLVDFPYVGQWSDLVRIIEEALAAKEMRAEKAEREIEEVRSAVCADDTETTAEAALHLAQAAEGRGRAAAIGAQVEKLSIGPQDVVLVRPELGDLPSLEWRHVMRRVQVGLRDLLAQQGVQHGGVVVLAPGWELGAVPREQLRALLDGDKEERVKRAEEAIYQKHFRASTFSGMRKMARLLAEDALAAADGEHVCASEKGA